MLMRSNLKLSVEPHKLSVQEWEEHTSEGHQWELQDGIPFAANGIERDRLAICLLYSMGFEYLFSILDPESLAILKHFAQKIKSTDQQFLNMWRYLQDEDRALSDHISRMNSAYEEGVELGKREVVISMAKSLLELKYSLEDIAEITDLSTKEIKKLIE